MNAQADMYRQKGFASLQAGRLDEAIQSFQQSAGADPDNYDTFAYLGAAYARQKNFESSRRAFGRAVQINPESAKARFNLGRAHEMAGDPIAARACYQAALDRDLHYAQASDALKKLPVPELNMSELAGPSAKIHLAGARASEFTDEAPDENAVGMTQAQIAALSAPGGAIHLAGAQAAEFTDDGPDDEAAHLSQAEIAALSMPSGHLHMMGAQAVEEKP